MSRHIERLSKNLIRILVNEHDYIINLSLTTHCSVVKDDIGGGVLFIEVINNFVVIDLDTLEEAKELHNELINELREYE